MYECPLLAIGPGVREGRQVVYEWGKIKPEGIVILYTNNRIRTDDYYLEDSSYTT